jgi:hypothetical protein
MPNLVFAAFLTLALAAPAAAATYVTPPVDVANGDVAVCIVQNASDQARTVTTRMWYGNPRVMADEDADVPIGPRVTLMVMNRSEPSTGVYCEIDGLSKKLRGYGGVVSVVGTTQFLMPATK